MTSNRFLACFGEASAVEAKIGRLYQREGLHAAYLWIEEHLIPRFQKEEANRLRR
jgi:dsRNA-specific ribonuclease